MQDISPEERLLRLIRGKHQKTSPKSEGTTKPVLPPTKKEDKSFSLARMSEYFSFNQINQRLLLVLIILAVYLLGDLLIASPKKIEQKVLALEQVKIKAAEISPEITAPTAEPVAYYTQATKAKNLFTATGPEAEQERPSASFLEIVSKLKLQGIISWPNPQAIIEDSKTQQVYFLSPGDYMGEIQLKEILQGKVKLNYYGQEAELAL